MSSLQYLDVKDGTAITEGTTREYLLSAGSKACFEWSKDSTGRHLGLWLCVPSVWTKISSPLNYRLWGVWEGFRILTAHGIMCFILDGVTCHMYMTSLFTELFRWELGLGDTLWCLSQGAYVLLQTSSPVNTLRSAISIFCAVNVFAAKIIYTYLCSRQS